MANSPIKIAIVCSHPIQYFALLFRNLAGQEEIDVTVFYCSKQSAEPREEVEATAARQGIADVQISGFLKQREISQAYVAADMLVLPSAWGETWGLVLNEAMNFGLPWRPRTGWEGR